VSDTERKLWTRDELLLAINLYCKIPFGRIHYTNPEVIELAEKLGRTPGSISYKLANFSSLDPTLDRKGAANVSKLDREVWAEFYDNWEEKLSESESKMSELKGAPKISEEFPALEIAEGETRETLVKTRRNQGLFRKIILSSYDGKCCITGIENSELLIASHIVPWSRDTKNRMNPMNGVCLNALHDRAFDKGLITINEDYKVVVSKRIKHELLLKYEKATISLPGRFHPDQNFLEFHRNEIFIG
jgi:predicted restriction endonuclease